MTIPSIARRAYVKPAAAAFVLLALLVATRWPIAPKRLYFFDSANFALALENFNPALHQPQPPGYPLFVGFTRLIHVAVADPQRVFLIAGLVASWIALLAIWRIGARMFGGNAGLLAAALLFANPPFWFGCVTNQIRIFLAVGSLGAGLLAWRSLEDGSRPASFYACFAWLGIAAGFRPVETMLLLPLLLWVWARTGSSVRRLGAALVVFCAAVAPSAVVTVNAIGGFHPAVRLFWDYAHDQFRGTSGLFGAAEPAAFKMAAEAAVWNGLGALAWIWALPLRATREAFANWGIRTRFLAIWFVPSFLFSALVHIGDPDQALTSVPILCVCGGAVLASLAKGDTNRRAWALAGLAVAVCALFFFLPPHWELARATSYRAVASIARITDGAIAAIGQVSERERSVIIDYGFPVSYRQISYYFPDDYVVFLPGMPASPSSAGDAWVFFHHKMFSAYPHGSEVVLPAAENTLYLLPWGVFPRKLAPGLPKAAQNGRVFYSNSFPQTEVQFGAYHLRVKPHSDSP